MQIKHSIHGNHAILAIPTSIVFTALALLLLAPKQGAVKKYYYNYFKEPVRLEIDVTQIAVHDPSGKAGALQNLGVPQLDASFHKEIPVAGWTILIIPKSEQSDERIHVLIHDASSRNSKLFFSPVFKTMTGETMIISNDILVRFKPDAEGPGLTQLAKDTAFEVLQKDWIGLKGNYRLRTSMRNGFAILDLANRLAESGDVVFAESDVLETTKSSSYGISDPFFPLQWGLNNTTVLGIDVGAYKAWLSFFPNSNPGAPVAVLDCGIQQDHPDLNLMGGKDYTGDPMLNGGPEYPLEDNHGTAVAGCICAKQNGLGVVGVAPFSKVWSARVCRTFQDGVILLPSWYANALYDVLSLGIRITSNSYSMSPSSIVTSAFDATQAAGVIHFAASGNDNMGIIAYPANLASVNAVGAINKDGSLGHFSNWGPEQQFVAPGIGIWTTDRTGFDGYSTDDYVFLEGTSLAQAYAAGVASLLLGVDPCLSESQVRQVLQSSALDLGFSGHDDFYGWGLINANSALTQVTFGLPHNDALTIEAFDANANDDFGVAVCITGDRAIIGANSKQISTNANVGAAYIFEKDGISDNSWSKYKKITAGDAYPGDFFGSSVSISGNRALVGAPMKQVSTNAQVGRSYVFEKSPLNNWVQTAELGAFDAFPGDQFGFSVSISGDYAIVGAPYKQVSSNPNVGAAYVFQRDSNGNWMQGPQLLAADAASGDLFGYSISLSGNRVAIGAPYKEISSNNECGAVYIFERDGSGNWSQINKKTASDAFPGDHFGWSVALSGDHAVVGAPNRAISTNPNCGAAYFIDRNDLGQWVEKQTFTAGDPFPGDSFGYSVSMGGGRALIGAPFKTKTDLCDVTNAGAAYLLEQDASGSWSQSIKLTSDSALAGDGYGWAVSVSDSYGLIGLPHRDISTNVNVGAADIYLASKGVIPFGVGSPGCNGLPSTVNVNVPPKIGTSNFAITYANGAPLSLGLGLISDVPDQIGSDPFFLGVVFQVDLLSATEIFALDINTDAIGSGVSPIAIPSDPTLVGKSYYAMALWVWSICTLPPFNLSTSDGLSITILPF
ncbi:MAG: S8 family serine peptidase [Planctomycetes bacterium]|nr:S8 family serine peptidase [Planctomycetota bacterium]